MATSSSTSESSSVIKRLHTNGSKSGYDLLEWVEREAKIVNPTTGEVVFEQTDLEFPTGFSQNAINIVAQKYFSGTPGTKDREHSLRQLVGRVVDTISAEGLKKGYFQDTEEASIFEEELKFILASQRAAFNSPVWFNIGVKDRSQQASACFILSVEDTMQSILNWYTEESIIFKGGSGSGINLSALRGSNERLSNSGGFASGPVSFMRGADASAGAIKSGGKTRRAAKMVILNVDHPDIEEFIWCKAIEERKSRALAEAGFDMGLNGSDAHSIQYQNANNSVRVTDDFMQAVEEDKDWSLLNVKDRQVSKKVSAKEVFRQIAEAAWECADPGLQFDTTINDWHTTPNAGRINGSNPCSEYMHLDNSACNLASINLLKYLGPDGKFNVDEFKHAVDMLIMAQEILVGYSEYPTEKIAENAVAYRELGLGYANLGALLMAQGLPYDSDEGRSQAAAITAIMTGRAYSTSAKIAKVVGPFAGYANDASNVNRVIKKHRSAVDDIKEESNASIIDEARKAWDEAVFLAEKYGVRNSQVSVLAPTGTIGLMMDCDTTGIEPDLSLVKHKNLVGGGMMTIVNKTVPVALKTLGYSSAQIEDINTYVGEATSIVGAPHIKEEHVPVFQCSMGDNPIHYLGHIKMMAAVQPFLSGAISKTVNMPEDVSVDDVEEIYMESWRLGLKAVAIYRDNCKSAQPLKTASKSNDESVSGSVDKLPVVSRERKRMPRTRTSKTFSFRVADSKGYIVVGEYDDGNPGEIFLTIAKQGSTLAGIMDALAVSISQGLQYGVPLKTYVKAFTNTSFAPAGMTDDPDIRTASSLLDYIFRLLAKEYLLLDDRVELGLDTYEQSQGQNVSQTSLGVAIEEPGQGVSGRSDSIDETSSLPRAFHDGSGPMCTNCGNQTQRAGSCYVCTSCGTTTGCS